MATQGTQKVLGGTPYKRYPDPNVTGTPNQFGLYPWSAFDANLSLFNAGQIEPVPSIPVTSVVDLLLFTSDIPAILKVQTEAAGFQYVWYVFNNTTSYIARTTPGGATFVEIDYGQVASGYVGLNKDIYCSGFPAIFEVKAPGEASTGGTPIIQCIANGAVINAPVGPASPIFLGVGPGVYGTPLAPLPIILLESDYTQAIRDAGNLIKDPVNSNLYQVVGLFEAVSTPP
jgi:hypothetical protein